MVSEKMEIKIDCLLEDIYDNNSYDNKDYQDYSTNEVLKNIMIELINTLNDDEQKIIKFAYGFEDGNIYSLEEIAIKINLSKDSIQEIKDNALRKFRHPSRTSRVQNFFCDKNN